MSPGPVFGAARYWEKRYATDGRLWGDGPSELARLAVARLRPSMAVVRDAEAPPLTLIDVGCGYGRDSRYLAAELGCRVLGLDASPAAIAAARKARRPGLDVEYVTGDAASLAEDAAQAGRFDVAFSGNVYHLLSPGGRRDFAAGLGALVHPAASSF